MKKEQRTCLACGRPLNGRKKKWCGHPDCGGWNAVHPPETKTCEQCGESFITYKESGYVICNTCKSFGSTSINPLTPRTCIHCGVDYSLPKSQGFLWCSGECYDKYFRKNPQPDYFSDDWVLSRNGLCFGCKTELESTQQTYGYCSPECDAIYQLRDSRRREELKNQIQENDGILASRVFDYAYIARWFDLHPDHTRRFVDREYFKRYHQARRLETVRIVTRKRLGLSDDAPLPERIPTTTELPIKIWLEENNIEFEHQCFIEIGDTYTFVDFFIPLSNSGVCLYCDGDYWHGPDFPDVQEKDRIQVKELRKLGYKVIRLWEKDIQNGIRPIEILELQDT